ncbi:hypothetical protein [Streptomyces sp. NPDC048606]|uniref:hypothetical protein n=1 Tax=Streptomyces sp. NPDC048606 TaxID=3154726 RepID=UPI0034498620
MTTAREITPRRHSGAAPFPGPVEVREPVPGAAVPGRAERAHAVPSHTPLGDGVLLVRLPGTLSIRERAGTTRAIDSLLGAYAPRHVIVDVPGAPTPATLSTVSRVARLCRAQGRGMGAVVRAARSRAVLRGVLPADGAEVHGSFDDALTAGLRDGRRTP